MQADNKGNGMNSQFPCSHQPSNERAVAGPVSEHEAETVVQRGHCGERLKAFMISWGKSV